MAASGGSSRPKGKVLLVKPNQLEYSKCVNASISP